MKVFVKVIFTSAIVLTALVSIACKDGSKKEEAVPMSSEMHQENVNDSGEVVNNDTQNSKLTAIVSEYLSIKNALVADNTDEAADAGGKLVAAFDGFDVSSYSSSEQNELKSFIDDAKQQAGQISDSPIKMQRVHFKALSKNVTEMVAITGTDATLYEQFCPMYDDGSVWLSMNEEVHNPYYGSKMLKCGKVRRGIN